METNELEIRIKNAEKELEAARLELKKLQEKPDKTKEMSDFLFDQFNSIASQKITGEKEVTMYNKEGQWIFQQDWKTGKLWVYYYIIVQYFQNEFALNHDQIRDFIQGWVETNIGWKGLTPNAVGASGAVSVETNIGWKGLMPVSHWRCNGL